MFVVLFLYTFLKVFKQQSCIFADSWFRSLFSSSFLVVYFSIYANGVPKLINRKTFHKQHEVYKIKQIE